jgi:polar amino acid transport system substrate-binding protein
MGFKAPPAADGAARASGTLAPMRLPRGALSPAVVRMAAVGATVGAMAFQAAAGTRDAADGGSRPQDAAAARTRLVVGVFDAPPFSEPLRRAEGDAAWTGSSIRLFGRIADAIGLEVEYRAGSESEVLAALAAGEIDACASPIAPTPERMRRVDFTHPFASTGIGAAVRTGSTVLDELGLVLDGLAKAAQRRIYLIMLVAVVLAAVGLWAVERRRNADFGSHRIHGFGSSLWWAIVTLTTVGYGDKVPRTPAGRLLAGTWMLASLVLTSVFTATIVSSLTVGSLQTVRIDVPGDLARIRVGAVRDSIAADWLGGLGIDPIPDETLSEAVARLAEGGCDAVVAPLIELRGALRDRDGLTVLPREFAGEFLCFGLARNLPPGLAERFDEEIVALTSQSLGAGGLAAVQVAPVGSGDANEAGDAGTKTHQ